MIARLKELREAYDEGLIDANEFYALRVTALQDGKAERKIRQAARLVSPPSAVHR